MARERHRVATVDELVADGDRVIREVDGHEIAIFRVGDDLHAVANYCVHQAGPLCEGPLAGRTTYDRTDGRWQYDPTQSVVRCPWHGWRFDLRTGKSLQSDRYAVPTYDVEVEDGDVYVRR